MRRVPSIPVAVFRTYLFSILSEGVSRLTLTTGGDHAVLTNDPENFCFPQQVASEERDI